MSPWNGVADCPQCGCKGTLLVSGRTSDIEIEGCWVCGFGTKMSSEELEFIPLHQLNLKRRSSQYNRPLN